MKLITFFEINETALETPLSRIPLNENEREVFDAINNLGASTVRRLHRELPGLSQFELNRTLGSLRDKHLITRRALSADDPD